ncbi:MAG TPA: hypothetical protein VF576_05955 [Rubricoccaceae bacterium]|jgi:hypothetical protein
MSNEALNTLILSVFLAAAVGAGWYVTKKQQPEELKKITDQIEAIENASAEVETLLAQEATASEEAALTLQRWNTRYKVLPPELTSADVVAYLNALSTRGFERFDLSLTGLTQGQNSSYYTYQVTGQAYFESLYAFIWHLENSRGLYRVRDLSVKKSVVQIPNPSTGVPRQAILAEFALAVDGYFSGNPDISAPDSAVVPPAEAFPARRVPLNPFFPYVLETLPGNTDDLVDIEVDNLVSVIGGLAVFMHGEEIRQLRAGDRVYLGRIANVDPQRGRVVVELNKGGVGERVELDLGTGERYRQHLGGATFQAQGRRISLPAGPSLQTAPPAPGTPEARDTGLYDRPAGAPAAPRSAAPPRTPQPYRPVPLGAR